MPGLATIGTGGLKLKCNSASTAGRVQLSRALQKRRGCGRKRCMSGLNGCRIQAAKAALRGKPLDCTGRKNPCTGLVTLIRETPWPGSYVHDEDTVHLDQGCTWLHLCHKLSNCAPDGNYSAGCCDSGSAKSTTANPDLVASICRTIAWL